MAKAATSAGLLIHRRSGGVLQFLLVHPGGPYWAKKDLGAWMIPKGEIAADEDPLACARREFEEETGLVVEGPFDPLTTIRQSGGKQVRCWLAEADLDLSALRSNTFEMEWPPRSGRKITVPEVDAAAYWPADEALNRILPSQRPLIEEALARLVAGT